MRRVMAQGDFRPMAQNREAMSDLVAILDARSADYARAEARARYLGRRGGAELRETRRDRRAFARQRRRVSMTALADQGFLDLGDMRLEYRMIGPRPDAAPTIVMLHEGLGCVGLWGDFPDKLQAATGAGVFVYSRAGYGKSSPVDAAAAAHASCTRKRREVLPRAARRDRLPARASARPQRRRLDRGDLRGLGAGPSRARAGADRAAFLHRGHGHRRDRARQGGLRRRPTCAQKLARWHADVDNAFRGWNDAWLDPDFRKWDITDELAYIRVPILIVQGADDQYGTVKQIEAARARMLLPGRGRAAAGRAPFAAPRGAATCCSRPSSEFANRLLRDHDEGDMRRDACRMSAGSRWLTPNESCANGKTPDRFPDRSVALPPLEARRRRRRRDADHGRRREGRAVRRLRAEAQFLRSRRRHRAGRRDRAAALRASAGEGRAAALRQAARVLRRRQYPHARGRHPRPQGQLLQVHQRDAQRHRGCERGVRPQDHLRDQRHRGRRRLRARARRRPHHAGRRRLVGGVAAGAAAAGGAARHRRAHPRHRQAQGAARPCRLFLHHRGRHQGQARGRVAAGRRGGAGLEIRRRR